MTLPTEPFSNAFTFSVILILLCGLVVSTYRQYLPPMSSAKENFAVASGALILITVAYTPIFFSTHLYWDDYHIVAWDRQSYYTHPHYTFIYSIGRPVANFFLFPLFWIISEFDTIYLSRLVSLSLTLVVFMLFYKTLVFVSIRRLHAFILSIIVVTSISFHVYNYWILASYIPMSIIFSLIAFLLATCAISDSRSNKKTVITSTSLFSYLTLLKADKKNGTMLLLSVLFLILCLSTYQPSAGFFTALIIFFLLTQTPSDTSYIKSSLLAFSFIYISAHLVYFAVFRVGLWFFSYDSIAPNYDTNGLSYLFDSSFLCDKLIWFIHVPLTNSANPLNIWSPMVSRWMLTLFAVSIGVCLIRELVLYRRNKKGAVWVFIKFAFIFLLIPLSHLAVIISDNSEANYRTVAALFVLVLLVNYLAVRSINQLLLGKSVSIRWKILSPVTLLLLGLAFFNLFNTYRSLNLFANRHAQEVAILRSEISSIPNTSIKEIQVTTPSYRPLANHPAHDLNRFSSYPGYAQPMMSFVFFRYGDVNQMPFIDLTVASGSEVSQVQKSRLSFDIRLVKEGYHHFNVIKAGRLHFAILQSEGAFEISRIENKSYSIFFTALSLKEILAKIDLYLKSPEQVKNQVVDENLAFYLNNKPQEFGNLEQRTKVLNINLDQLLRQKLKI